MSLARLLKLDVQAERGLGFSFDFVESIFAYNFRLSEAHARLSRRSEVTAEDAVAACHYYEECEAGLTGHSHLGVTPRPHSLGVSLDQALGPGHDSAVREFQARLVSFTQEHADIGVEVSAKKDNFEDFLNLSSEE